MGSSKCCVYNRNKGIFLSRGVAVVDTTQEPFKALIEDLAQGAHSGAWLRPFRGIPEARHLPRFDLLYLDDQDRVIKGSELFSVHEFAPFSGRVASAIVLPPGAIGESGTRAGDRLKIAPAEDLEMVGWLMQAQTAKATTDLSGMDATNPDGRAAAGTAKRGTEHMSASGPEGRADAGGKKKLSLFGRIGKWLNQEKDQRRAERRSLPGLVAFYWTGGAPQSFELSNISLTGIYLLTDERWVIDTVLQMRLQITKPDQPQSLDSENQGDPEDSIAVLAKVVRWGVDGVGLQFVFKLAGPKGSDVGLHGSGTDLQVLLNFLRRVHITSGVDTGA
ncbi:MAG TPA: PilZ domain-containing protein [Terracidiphilus sp.]|jgi:hypothetical protein|nr:PilZ domain-containing protein [Terracidiphilus sp.]